MFRAALAHMDVRPILVIVGVPEQEVPDDLGRDVEKYLWHIALDYRPQIYNFIVNYFSLCLHFLYILGEMTRFLSHCNHLIN